MEYILLVTNILLVAYILYDKKKPSKEVEQKEDPMLKHLQTMMDYGKNQAYRRSE